MKRDSGLGVGLEVDEETSLERKFTFESVRTKDGQTTER